MKKTTVSAIVGVVALGLMAFTPASTKLVSSKTHCHFFSTTPAENIEANNYKAVSTIDTKSGDVVFSVPMQSFEFEKALMQKHFNSAKFLDTKTNPKAKFTGTITNLANINFDKDGTYNATIRGEMTIKGKTKPVNEKGTITVAGSTVKVNTQFNITLADYEIAFEKGKPSTNIAKTVEIKVEAEYQPGS